MARALAFRKVPRVETVTLNVCERSSHEVQTSTQRVNPHFSVRRERRCFSVGVSPTRQLSLQPAAIGATVEVTKRLKPSV